MVLDEVQPQRLAVCSGNTHRSVVGDAQAHLNEVVDSDGTTVGQPVLVVAELVAR